MIDVHHHFLPQQYVEALEEAAIPSGTASGKLPYWSRELALEAMDRSGIGASILSISNPGVGEGRLALRLARMTNEFAARLRDDLPSRFGFFASLPMPEPGTALAEIRYAFDELNADGAVLFTNYGGSYLGADIFTPVLEELNRRAAVVLVHPASPVGGSPVKGLSEALIEFPVETARAAISLLSAGVPDAFPSIRFILPHAGGVLPYLSSRIELLAARNPNFKTRGDGAIVKAIQSFYYDVAVSLNKATVDALCAAIPDKRILFGTDMPFVGAQYLEKLSDRLEAVGLGRGAGVGAMRENARGLFPRLGKAAAGGASRVRTS